MEKIKGLIDAPFTPFYENGEVNYEPIEAYAKLLVKNGLKGVFINGSSGEGYMLTDEERMKLAERWVEVAPSGFKVIVHVGSTCVKASHKLAAHAQKIGAWGIGAMASPFPKVNRIEELVKYCEEIASGAPELPFYYYHIPAFNGAFLPMVELLKAVDGRIPNFAGIKYTYESLYEYNQCRLYKDGKFDMLHGQDETILPCLAMGGAQGGIGGTTNYNGKELTGILEAWAAGDLETARERQNFSQEVINVICRYRGNIVGGKRIVGSEMCIRDRYGIDHENGGYFTCLDRDGSLLDTNKSVWFQGRFAFILAYAYNNLEKQAEWLEACKNGIDFIEKYCFDTDGRMFYEVTKTGTPVRKRRYVFSETFAAIAMAQYSIASGDKSYAEKAVKLFKQILYYKNTPGALEPKFREGFVAKGHSFCMILIDTAARIREAVDDPVLTRQIDESIAELRRDFMKPEFKAILETVGPNGEFIDSIPGRTINPGHSIETAWFILEEAKHRNWDPQLKQIGLTILDWSWEWGWDKTHGGITYFRDCKNRPQQEYWHDMKFWWPQCEAIIATLYAYEATGDPKYLEMHKQINEYTYARFPDKEYGEWFGYFHYDGTLSQPAKGNMYKGPFHIPRMLLKCHLLCKEIQGYDKQ